MPGSPPKGDRVNLLPYYCVGQRAENFRWFAKSLGTFRLHNPDIPIAVICDREMEVEDPAIAVYRWPMRIILDSMIARAFILEILPKAPDALLYIDTDTACCQPIDSIIKNCPLPGFWATKEPKRLCFIGSEMSGKYAMTRSEVRKATSHHEGSFCSGVWYTDVDTARNFLKIWAVETYKMAAKHKKMTERGDWRTGDQATLNTLIYRGWLQAKPLEWHLVRPFAPPYYFYDPRRAPVISHFSGDPQVKRNIWSFPGEPVKLHFPRGDDPFQNKKAEPLPPLELSEPKKKHFYPRNPIQGKIPMKTAVVSVIVKNQKKDPKRLYDANGFEQIVSRALPTHVIYAQQIGAEHRTITSQLNLEIDVSFERNQVWRLFEYEKYDRIILLDADTLIRQDAISLFDLVPAGKIGAFDEGAGSPIHEQWMEEIFQLTGRPRAWKWNGLYLNGGVLVVDRIHRDLFKNKPVDQQAHLRGGATGYLNWYLQINGGIPVCRLPAEYNWMPACNPGIPIAEVAKRAYIVHVNSFPLSTRLKIMDDITTEWESGGLF